MNNEENRAPTLFDVPPRPEPKLYDGTPPHVRGSNTSESAARQIRDSADSIRRRVFAEIKTRGKYGATCDAIEEVLDLRHQTASARVRELVLQGHIRDSGERRPTRSGRPAAVYIALDERNL